jgi:hypothetical protein
MPKSFHEMTTGEIELAAIEGNLTGPEQDWFNRRKGRPIDFSRYGNHGWML